METARGRTAVQTNVSDAAAKAEETCPFQGSVSLGDGWTQAHHRRTKLHKTGRDTPQQEINAKQTDLHGHRTGCCPGPGTAQGRDGSSSKTGEK